MSKVYRRIAIAWPGASPRAVRMGAGILLPLLIAGCSFVPDWADPSGWFEESEEPGRISASGDQADGAAFPNLASVPGAVPAFTAPDERAQIRRGLAADQANARYTDERLVGEDSTPAGAPKSPAVLEALVPPKVRAAPPPAPKAPAKAAAKRAPATAPNAARPAPSAAAVQPAPRKPAAQPAAPKALRAGGQQLRFAQFRTAPSAPSAPSAASAPPPRGPSELVGVIYFDDGSAGLDDQDRQVLRQIVALHTNRGGSIRVVGHASARTGTVDPVRHRVVNLEISQRRADAVAAMIVSLGAARAKVRADAQADSQPVYHEFMPSGEAGNRRAEVFLEF